MRGSVQIFMVWTLCPSYRLYDYGLKQAVCCLSSGILVVRSVNSKTSVCKN